MGWNRVADSLRKMVLALGMSLWFTFGVAGGIRGDLPATPEPPPSISLLFVGNSLTYTHDVPGLLTTLLDGAGIETRVEGRLGPNLGLQDHWESRSTQRRIRRGGWDYVIFQQGPSATEGRPSLLDYGERFSRLVMESGARPAFYMVWPSSGRSFDFPAVSESYRMVAARNEALLFPVGDAWRAAWREDSEIQLYGPDGFHPSELGSYLAALVIFQELSGAPLPEKAPESWVLKGDRWEQLVDAAQAVRSTIR